MLGRRRHAGRDQLAVLLPLLFAAKLFVHCRVCKHGQGPAVQSVVSLTNSLVVKMLTVLVSTISNSQGFFAEKMWVAFANAKSTHIFFSKNISIYAILNGQSLKNMLTNDIVSFEQLGPDVKAWLDQLLRSLHKVLLLSINIFSYFFTKIVVGTH